MNVLKSYEILDNRFADAFTYAKLILVCEATDDLSLPLFSGSAFRGVFGHCLRRLVCVARSTLCAQCPISPGCTYTTIFEPQQNPSLPIYKTVKDPPRPFVLHIPSENEIRKGNSFQLGITLFGKAIAHFPWVIQAVAHSGKKGLGRRRETFSLIRVLSSPFQKVIFESDRLLDRPDIQRPDFNCVSDYKNKVVMQFETPTRIKFNGSLVDKFEFSTIVRQLLRRIAQMGAFHCGMFLETDFNFWIQQAKAVACVEENLEWFDWTRFSNRQKQRMQLGGLMGHAFFTGDIEPFLPLLILGQTTHMGKGATFGLGRYKLMEPTYENPDPRKSGPGRLSP